MFRRSSIIVAASLLILSTFEPLLCFAAAAPAVVKEEAEKPRYLKKEVKRFWPNATSSHTDFREDRQPPVSSSSMSSSMSSSLSSASSSSSSSLLNNVLSSSVSSAPLEISVSVTSSSSPPPPPSPPASSSSSVPPSVPASPSSLPQSVPASSSLLPLSVPVSASSSQGKSNNLELVQHQESFQSRTAGGPSSSPLPASLQSSSINGEENIGSSPTIPPSANLISTSPTPNPVSPGISGSSIGHLSLSSPAVASVAAVGSPHNSPAGDQNSALAQSSAAPKVTVAATSGPDVQQTASSAINQLPVSPALSLPSTSPAGSVDESKLRAPIKDQSSSLPNGLSSIAVDLAPTSTAQGQVHNPSNPSSPGDAAVISPASVAPASPIANGGLEVLHSPNAGTSALLAALGTDGELPVGTHPQLEASLRPPAASQPQSVEVSGQSTPAPSAIQPPKTAQPASPLGPIIVPATGSSAVVIPGAPTSVPQHAPSEIIDSTIPPESSLIVGLSKALQTATTLSNGAVVPLIADTNSAGQVSLVPASVLNSAGVLVANTALMKPPAEASVVSAGPAQVLPSITLSNGKVVGVTPVTDSAGSVATVPLLIPNSAGSLEPNPQITATSMGSPVLSAPAILSGQHLPGAVLSAPAVVLSGGLSVPAVQVANSVGSLGVVPLSTFNSAGSLVPNAHAPTAVPGIPEQSVSALPGNLGPSVSAIPGNLEQSVSAIPGNLGASISAIPGNLEPSVTAIPERPQSVPGVNGGLVPSPQPLSGGVSGVPIPASITNSNGQVVPNPSFTPLSPLPAAVSQDQALLHSLSNGAFVPGSATVSNGQGNLITSPPEQMSSGSPEFFSAHPQILDHAQSHPALAGVSGGVSSLGPGQSAPVEPVASNGVVAGQSSGLPQSQGGSPASVAPVLPASDAHSNAAASGPPPALTAGPVASGPQVYPSHATGPFSQEPTAYNSATQLGVPSSIVFTSAMPPSQAPSGPTGLPTGVPLVLYPPTGPVERPPDTDLIQIGFLFALNYEFVFTHDESQRQIFKFLPMGISFGLAIELENVTMQTLRAWDTTEQLHYITTLALVWIPKGLADRLGLIIHTPSAPFYNNSDPSVKTLLQMVNPALPIYADDQTDGNGSNAFGLTPNNTSLDGNGAPIGGGLGNNSPVKASSVGIGVGVCFAATAYGAAMFLIARRYKKKRSSHLRSPSAYGSPVMSHAGPDPAAGAALMSGAMGDRSLSPYHDDDGRGSRGSGRTGSSGRQQISAPVMAENSLGWN